ncbi:hypothetical protein OHT20_30690 [Streptomyces caniferus]|uniref:Uncharacterized protein n=1 Tax=Streptomyces caniferus TaxID=285557 RepID=A0A640SEU4_9ACTN|nr:hypothetical protein [Streptomyces caniferus]GFE08931.1 hypothetical protein Scani_51990 [Streptomyces caniferus]
MDNELYVVWMVRTSDRAMAAAEEALGNFAAQDLLHRIDRFGAAESRLTELAARIRAAFTPPELPAVFTGRHLHLLVGPAAQPLLAELLRCPESDVFATLFDAHQLAQALRETGPHQDGIDDAELLLLALLARLPRLAARHGLESRDWGGFVEDRGWLTPYAGDRLTELARRREWPADAAPTQILAGLLEGVGGRRDADRASQFDALALIELRRRTGLLSEQLRGDALEHAEEAARLAPDLTSVSRLPAWLELYEQQAVALGMRRLFTGCVTVGEQLAGLHSQPPPETGKPKPDENLQVINEVRYGFLKRRMSFDIACEVEGSSHPVVVLRCRGVTPEQYPVVRDTVHRLRGSDLSAQGEGLGERLLNTAVPQRLGLPGRLRSALRDHSTEAVQCVVLTGIRRPVAVPAPWCDHLRTALPYASPSGADSVFPAVPDVTRALRASVPGSRRVVEVE